MSADPDTYYSTSDPDFGASPEPPDPPEEDPEPTPELLAGAAHDVRRAIAAAIGARDALTMSDEPAGEASRAAQELAAEARAHLADALRVLTGQPPEGAADRLAAMIDGLQDHIDARAAEIAESRIAAAQADADTRVDAIRAHAEVEGERSGALVSELRRQLASCDRTIERLSCDRHDAARALNAQRGELAALRELRSQHPTPTPREDDDG